MSNTILLHAYRHTSSLFFLHYGQSAITAVYVHLTFASEFHELYNLEKMRVFYSNCYISVIFKQVEMYITF